MKKSILLVLLALCCISILLGCAAGPEGHYDSGNPAGFWTGIWHGFIAWITFVLSLFTKVQMYSLSNTGWPYNLGFLIGMACWLGGSGSSWKHSRKSPKDKEWDEVAQKVEKKLKRELRDWADSEDGEDWEEVERKVEQKVKRIIKQWAEK